MPAWAADANVLSDGPEAMEITKVPRARKTAAAAQLASIMLSGSFSLLGELSLSECVQGTPARDGTHI